MLLDDALHALPGDEDLQCKVVAGLGRTAQGSYACKSCITLGSITIFKDELLEKFWSKARAVQVVECDGENGMQSEFFGETHDFL